LVKRQEKKRPRRRDCRRRKKSEVAGEIASLFEKKKLLEEISEKTFPALNNEKGNRTTRCGLKWKGFSHRDLKDGGKSHFFRG